MGESTPTPPHHYLPQDRHDNMKSRTMQFSSDPSSSSPSSHQTQHLNHARLPPPPPLPPQQQQQQPNLPLPIPNFTSHHPPYTPFNRQSNPLGNPPNPHSNHYSPGHQMGHSSPPPQHRAHPSRATNTNRAPMDHSSRHSFSPHQRFPFHQCKTPLSCFNPSFDRRTQQAYHGGLSTESVIEP